MGFVLICESVADDGGTQSALRASKARVTGGALRVGRQLPSASRWVPCGAERKLIGHFPLTVAEQRLCVTKHTALLWGGEDAIDPPLNYTPMNEHKANFVWWSVVTDVLHDSLTLCNWVWPMAMSPSKTRDYRGDLDLEAQFFTAVTGEEVTTEQLYKAGAKIMTLQRANTVRGMTDASGKMGCNDMRTIHDCYTEWPFTKDPDFEVFTEGTNKMDKEELSSLGLLP